MAGKFAGKNVRSGVDGLREETLIELSNSISIIGITNDPVTIIGTVQITTFNVSAVSLPLFPLRSLRVPRGRILRFRSRELAGIPSRGVVKKLFRPC